VVVSYYSIREQFLNFCKEEGSFVIFSFKLGVFLIEEMVQAYVTGTCDIFYLK
jgi:hypothetical protein